MFLKDKVLIVYLHGIGDTVLLTPTLKELSKYYEVDLVLLKKNKSAFLFENLPYINELYEIEIKHPKPWIYPKYRFIEYPSIISNLRKNFDLEIYKKIYIPAVQKYPDSLKKLFPKLRKHRIFQISDEFNIRLSNLKTEISYDKNIKEEDFILIHYRTEDISRSLSENLLLEIINNFPNENFVVIDKDKNLVLVDKVKGLNNAEYLFGINLENLVGIIASSKKVIAIDSAIFHIAGAMEKSLIGIFTNSKVKFEERKPLHYKKVLGLDTEGMSNNEILSWLEENINNV